MPVKTGIQWAYAIRPLYKDSWIPGCAAPASRLNIVTNIWDATLVRSRSLTLFGMTERMLG